MDDEDAAGLNSPEDTPSLVETAHFDAGPRLQKRDRHDEVGAAVSEEANVVKEPAGDDAKTDDEKGDEANKKRRRFEEEVDQATLNQLFGSFSIGTNHSAATTAPRSYYRRLNRRPKRRTCRTASRSASNSLVTEIEITGGAKLSTAPSLTTDRHHHECVSEGEGDDDDEIHCHVHIEYGDESPTSGDEPIPHELLTRLPSAPQLTLGNNAHSKTTKRDLSALDED